MLEWIGWIALVLFGGYCGFACAVITYGQLLVSALGGRERIWPWAIFYLAGCIACWFLAYHNAPFTIEVKP